MKRTFLLILLAACISCVSANPPKETFQFVVRGDQTLQLDKYDNGSTEARPCVIFVFGGGFANGERDGRGNVAFMERLAERGYVAIAIDYRLGMKNASKTETQNMPALLARAIDMATEDLFSATAFVLEHSKEWNIDPQRIVACGSSAGAITALQAEYLICGNGAQKYGLPEGFNYGGVISFAGAIIDMKAEPVWKQNPAPVMMFHGDADRSVPFDKVKFMTAGMYGSKYIAAQLQQAGSPYWFYEVRGAAHEISGLPMRANLNEIETFIRDFVTGHKPLQITTAVSTIGAPTESKPVTPQDYIDTNYRPR